ncbi:hypothetical protein ACHQM5_028266 [Ranunculus cassubicifolius]
MSLFAIAAGINQKNNVNEMVMKVSSMIYSLFFQCVTGYFLQLTNLLCAVLQFPSSHFVIMIFHYDGVVDEWSDLEWNHRAIHVSALNQTKWWFAKRFLHPDIVADYKYIFLWDEDLGVENFDPLGYLTVVEKEGLEISQPGLDGSKSEVHHQITIRGRRSNVHSWVEMMAPVFSRSAWRCTWYMIQNDLIHAWGLDKQLGYCAQGDRTKNVGVVDSEFIVHQGLPTLGGIDENKVLIFI